MYFIDNPNIDKTKNEINTLTRERKNLIVVKARFPEYNRKILEYGKFDVLLSIEKTDGKDKIKQLDSGLNEVLAKIAARNNVALGIDMEDIRNLEKKEKARRLGRIIQNIQICRKAKCKIVLLNYKDKKDANDFFISLGASTEQARNAINY